MAATKKGKCPDCGTGHVSWTGSKTDSQRTLKCDNCSTETVVNKGE